MENNRKKTDIIILWLDRNKFALLVIAAAILVRLPYIDMMQRWDAGEYYWRFSQAVKNFQFTGFAEYMSSFCLCGHSTMVFCLIYLPGELLFPEKIIGVSITSYILTAIALWCIYKVLLRCINGIDGKDAAICTAVISFSPLFYGTATYFNPDYALACFVVIAVYAFVYDKPILAGIASLACFQTKETGLVIIFGLVVGTFVRHICAENKEKSAIKRIATDGCLYATLVSTILQLIYMVSIGGASGWSKGSDEAGSIIWNNEGSECFGFNVEYVITKLKQQFVLNFNWIFALVIVLGIIALIAHSKKNDSSKEKNEYLHCLISPFATFVIFSCLYITSPMARYNVIGDLLLYMIAICVAWRSINVLGLKGKTVIIRTVSGVTALLLVLQCFVTIDPLTLYAFKRLDAGTAFMCFTGEKYIDDNDIFYGDYLVYNTQYTYIDRAYDYVLKEAGFDTSWEIIVNDEVGNFINGNMYRLNWDSKLKKRVFYTNQNTVPMDVFYMVRELEKYKTELADKAILIINPYYVGTDSQALLNETLKYYSCVNQGEYRSIRGSIYYYVLEKTENIY